MSTHYAAPRTRRTGWLMWRSCLSKRRYRTASDASKIAARINQSQPDKVHSYFCEFCQGHHIGHPRREP